MKRSRNAATQVDIRYLIRPFDSADLRLGAGLFLGILVLLYIPTLAPSIVGGDAGELVAAACGLGSPHPPGYPLHWLVSALLVHVGPRLAGAEPAWFVSLLSAVCMSGAAALIGVLASVLVPGSLNGPATGTLIDTAARRAPAALFASLGFASGPVVWEYAVTPEVFGLHALLVALLLFFAIRPRDGESPSWLAIGALSGLGAAHHHTLVFFVAPVIWLHRESFASRRTGWPRFLAGAGAGCLVPYSLLAVLQSKTALFSWGDWTSFHGFWNHFTRAEYGTFALGNPGVDGNPIFGGDSTFVGRLGRFLEGTLRSTAGGLGLLGAAIACRQARRARTVRFILGALAFYVFVFHALAQFRPASPMAIAIASRFWIQAWIPIWILAGWGLASVMKSLRTSAIVPFLLALGIAVAQAAYFRSDIIQRTRQAIISDFSHQLLAQVDGTNRPALILARGDHAYNGLIYRKACLDEAPRTAVLAQNLLTYPWYSSQLRRSEPGLRWPEGEGVALPWQTLPGAGGFTMRQLLDVNRDRDVYLVNGFNTWDPSLRQGYLIWPWGFLERVLPLTAPPDFQRWLDEDSAAAAAWDWRRTLPYAEGTWEFELQHQYWHTRHLRANRIIQHASEQNPAHPGEIRAAIAIYESLLAELPGREENVIFKNLGVAYRALIPFEPTAEAKMYDAWKRFVAHADPTDPDPDLPKIRMLISGH